MFMQVVVIGAILTPGFFPFFSIIRLQRQYRPFVPSFVFEFTVRGAQESSQPQSVFAQPIAYRDAQFICIQLFENKCVNLYLHLSILRGCVDTQLVLCLIATRVWFIRCFPYHQKNLGDPGSSRGTLEHIRVGLTLYMAFDIFTISYPPHPPNIY